MEQPEKKAAIQLDLFNPPNEEKNLEQVSKVEETPSSNIINPDSILNKLSSDEVDKLFEKDKHVNGQN